MIRGADTYNVFVRNWWRIENGRRVPDPGAQKRYIARGVSETEAREICAEYRANHEPGELSRKAEFEAA
jgi:hypothetical protein